MVPTEGVEPTHPYEYQILSLARLPIPPRRQPKLQGLTSSLVSALTIATVLPYETGSNPKQFVDCLKLIIEALQLHEGERQPQAPNSPGQTHLNPRETEGSWRAHRVALE